MGIRSYKRNARQQRAARRRLTLKRTQLSMRVISPDDIYLPPVYERHAPMTYGIGKRLIRIGAGRQDGNEVVG